MNTRQTSNSKRHLTVLAFYILVTLVMYSIVDFGNQIGADSWGHLYGAINGQFAYSTSRPLTLLPIFLIFHMVELDHVGGHAIVIGVVVVNAYLLYLNINLFLPRSIYAYLVGLVYLLYVVGDSFFLLNIYAVSDQFISLALMQLCLYCYFRFVLFDALWMLFAGAVLAIAAMFMREALIPLISGLPVIAFALRRNYSWESFRKLLYWGIVVALGALWYALPLFGIAGETYASGFREPFSIAQFMRRTIFHARVSLDSVLFLEAAKINRVLLPSAMLWIVSTASLLLVSTFQKADVSDDDGVSFLHRVSVPLLWIVLGGVVWFLGLFAFLLTIIADGVLRVHAIAPLGVAMLLAGLIWLAYTLLAGRIAQHLVLMLSALYLGTTGIVQLVDLQDELYVLNSNWDDQAEFFRRLTHLAPHLEDDTLIVHVQPRGTDESPYIFGFGLDYAVRYLYADRAIAIITNDNNLGTTWRFQPEGVEIVLNAQQLTGPLYASGDFIWDEIIFITKTDSGQVEMFSSISPQQLSEVGAFNANVDVGVIDEAGVEAYAPLNRVTPGYVSQRVQAVYPPIQTLDALDN